MARNRRTRSNAERKHAFAQIAKQLFWFFFVPVLSVLEYYTQIRPYILANYGLYIVGFIDGAFTLIAIMIVIFWLISMIPSE
jgi:hypothetical protein